MNTTDLVKLLPAGYEDACYEKKAITRKRTITNPLDLLRLILFYLSGNKSLIDVSQFALMSSSDEMDFDNPVFMRVSSKFV